VEIWRDQVYYAGALVTHRGCTWQAMKDTGREPGAGEDWLGIALRGADGQDGADGLGFVIRGTFDAGKSYSKHDVVMLSSSSFVARCDNPGACPGPNWQLFASAGKKGDRGPAGDRGQSGAPGAAKRATWKYNVPNYTLTEILDDGSEGAILDLRPFLEQYHAETR
jgi:hypothetical protein